MTVTVGNGKMDAMNDTVKIIVLDDGSLWSGEAEWSGEADIFTITRAAYNKMIDEGLTPDNLDPEDIIETVRVYDNQND